MKTVKESASGAEAESSRSPPVSKNEAVLTYYGSIPHGMNDWPIIWRHSESQKYKIDSLAKRSIMNPLCVNTAWISKPRFVPSSDGTFDYNKYWWTAETRLHLIEHPG